MKGKNGMTTVWRVSIATQTVSATDGIDCSIFSHPSHFKDCVAISMCLIVANFSLSYCSMLVGSLCSNTLIVNYKAREEGPPEMYFSDRQNLSTKSRPSHFLMSCYGNMFDHDCALLVFLWSAMVVYPCDIHEISRLLTGKKGQSVRRNDDQLWIWPSTWTQHFVFCVSC